MATVARLELDDFLPDFQLINQHGKRTELITTALGKSIVVLFFPDDRSSATRQLLRGFVEHEARLAPIIHLLTINGATAESNAGCSLYSEMAFPVLADPDGTVAGAYGVPHGLGGGVPEGAATYTSVIADANCRVVRIDCDINDSGLAAKLRDYFASRPQPQPREVTPMAPVLYVPRVFDQDFCRRMINLYETGSTPSGVFRDDYREAGGQLTPDTKMRRDHIVVDRAIHEEIGRHIGKRVVPDIRRAFSFQVNFIKEFKIACYEAASRGFFRPHRDNIKPTGSGRRFAMTLNLNTGEYEGGYLRFPEYGPHLYRPAAGDAVVFACNLVHEATPVIAGRRFVLLTFFYGPDGEDNSQG